MYTSCLKLAVNLQLCANVITFVVTLLSIKYILCVHTNTPITDGTVISRLCHR